jgi:tryptophanase
LDARRFAPNVKPEHFPGQSILLEIYRLSGVRTVEIGSLMFGKRDEEGNFIAPPMDLVRLAIPRRVYTKSHIEYVAEAIIETYKNVDKLKGLKITWEPEFLRHFTCRLEYID